MVADTKIELAFMPVRALQPRLPASLLASAGLHALALATFAWLGNPFAFPPPRAQVFPVELVSLVGGGGGPAGEAGPPVPAPPRAAPPPPPRSPPANVPAPAPSARTIVKKVRRKPAAKPRADTPAPSLAVVAPPTAGATGGSGTPAGVVGGKGGGTGGGDGTGGDGSGGARPAYGSNPKPLYPHMARTLKQEGVVMLEIVVRPDGRVDSVRVKKSSGYRLLDESAVNTVKAKWRFVPARRGGIPVTSTATVPIRFYMKEG